MAKRKTKTKEEILIGLNCVLNDCKKQADSLEEDSILLWDVHDEDNWRGMEDTVAEAIQFVKGLK